MSSSLPSIEDKRSFIEQKIEAMFQNPNKSDLLALDLEMNLLICAVKSYKHETVLKPFPSTFLSDSNNNKDFNELISAVDSLPPLPEWRSKIKRFTPAQLSLIYWFFVHKNYDLEYSSDVTQEKLKEMSKYTDEHFSKPTHVFEIKYNEEKTRKFEQLKQQLADKSETTDSTSLTSISFHGTRMDNIYSILHMGLLSHFSKNALFGEGTYLSQEPSISLHYSPANKTWNKSVIGQRMSCLLVAETINDPSHVKTGINENSNVGDEKKKSTNVPEKYFIVSNNDYVRVKYVLIYAEKSKPKRKNKLLQLLNENKFALLLLAYSMLLGFIGLMNSRTFHKYMKLSYTKLSNLFIGDSSNSVYE